NEMNMPADWLKENAPIGYEWIEASRAQRIAEVFSAEAVHTLAGSRALQTDVMSLPARRVSALIAGLDGRDDAERAALRMLKRWDHRVDAASAAAALFEVWFTRHLRPAMIAAVVADPQIRTLIGLGDVETVLTLLERDEIRWNGGGRADLLL